MSTYDQGKSFRLGDRYPSRAPAKSTSNVPYLVGGAVLVGTLYWIWRKAPPRQLQSMQSQPQTQLQPGLSSDQVASIAREAARREYEARQMAAAREEATTSFPQVPNAPSGYAGPGMYRIIASKGLSLRATPGTNQPASRTLPLGTLVEVLTATTNGWAQISSPEPGYLCMSCNEAPGGPWIVRQA